MVQSLGYEPERHLVITVLNDGTDDIPANTAVKATGVERHNTTIGGDYGSASTEYQTVVKVAPCDSVASFLGVATEAIPKNKTGTVVIAGVATVKAHGGGTKGGGNAIAVGDQLTLYGTVAGEVVKQTALDAVTIGIALEATSSDDSYIAFMIFRDHNA